MAHKWHLDTDIFLTKERPKITTNFDRSFYYFYLRIIFVFSKTQRQYQGSR